MKVSELCLGAMTFGGGGMWTAIGTLQQEQVNAMIKQSVDNGINFIDTANVYSEGLSERMTGQAIRDLGLKRDNLVIATKVRGKMGLMVRSPLAGGLLSGKYNRKMKSVNLSDNCNPGFDKIQLSPLVKK